MLFLIIFVGKLIDIKMRKVLYNKVRIVLDGIILL